MPRMGRREENCSHPSSQLRAMHASQSSRCCRQARQRNAVGTFRIFHPSSQFDLVRLHPFSPYTVPSVYPMTITAIRSPSTPASSRSPTSPYSDPYSASYNLPVPNTCGLLIGGACRSSVLDRNRSRRRCVVRLLCILCKCSGASLVAW